MKPSIGERLERMAASGFDAARQPNGNRIAASIEKSLQIQEISGSANGIESVPARLQAAHDGRNAF